MLQKNIVIKCQMSRTSHIIIRSSEKKEHPTDQLKTKTPRESKPRIR